MVKTTLIGWILLLIGLSNASFPSELQQYATADWPTLGYVGCRFSKALCSYDEVCVDDGLFGSCQKINDPLPDFYQHRLTKTQQRQLEFILSRLIQFGYVWSDSYTQCIISGVLQTYRSGINYDLDRCDVEQRDESRQRPQFEDLDRNYEDRDEEFLTPVTSDEFQADEADYQPPVFLVDEKLQQRNRKPLNDLFGIERRSGRDEEPGIADFEEFLSGLSEQDIAELEKYVADDLERGQQVEKKASRADYLYSYDDGPQLTDEYPNNENWYYQEPYVDKKDDMDMDVVHSPPNSDVVMSTRVNVNFDPGTDSDGETGKDENSKQTDGSTQQQQDAKDSTADTQKQPSVAAQQSKNGPVKSAPVKSLSGTDNIATFRQSTGSENGNSRSSYSPELKPVGRMSQKYVLTMYVLCGLVGAVTLGAVVIYIVRRRSRLHEKLASWVTTGAQQPSEEYQDLCRQHMQTKFSEKLEPVHPASRIEPVAAVEDKAARTGSTGSSTSSWTEEPVTSNLDISTGHIVLAYMEDHLKNKDRLQQEWETLSAYDPEPCSIVAAIEPTNMRKNRYTDILPYEHSRVKLTCSSNVSGSDYINASTIMDHDPRNPAYIATQGPLPHTVADFWQMIWEQGSVVIVNLTRLTENGVTVCHRYWPEEGSDLYHIYEVHLVSEHVWCEDYVIRSFYLKNLQTSETRTVTQFHFVAWPNNEVPSSAKTLLDFRRKVNKSFRSRSSPIVVHCSDGAGRTGTYCLIDMVLNRLSKGAKEIDIAATLEHIRDQRVNMVRTKEQFEFALAAVAHEVQAILHAPP